MVRQIHVTLPAALAPVAIEWLVHHPEVHGLSSSPAQMHAHDGDVEDAVLLIFRQRDKTVAGVLSELEGRFGVGATVGRVDILALQGTKPRLVSRAKKKKRGYRVTDRLHLEEIYDAIDANNHLTFNYLFFLLISSSIAAVGLTSEGGSVIVLSSMLLSPLLGPILALTLGTVIADREMALRGLRNESIGILLTFFVGFVVGVIVSGTDSAWGNIEQESRGTTRAIINGIAVAVPSGAGVALAITGGGVSALVGVAIAAALLPPIVNSGLHSGKAMVEGSSPDVDHYLTIAQNSFFLFLVNFILIYLVALAVFRLKQVDPDGGGLARAAVQEGRAHREHTRLVDSHKSSYGAIGEPNTDNDGDGDDDDDDDDDGNFEDAQEAAPTARRPTLVLPIPGGPDVSSTTRARRTSMRRPSSTPPAAPAIMVTTEEEHPSEQELVERR